MMWAGRYGAVLVVLVCITHSVSSSPPTVLEGPKTTTTVVGSTVILKCRVTGDPNVTITWSDKFGTLNKTDTFYINENGDLTIRNVVHELSSRYMCTAQNSEGTVVESAHLFVQDKTIVTSLEPVDHGYRLLAGKTAKLRCTVQADTNNPNTIISWQFNKTYINDDKTKYTINKYQATSVLTINDARGEDSGIYTCIASSTVDKASMDYTLLVTDVPGSPKYVDFQCREENFQANIKWTASPDISPVKTTAFTVKAKTSHGLDDWEIDTVQAPRTSILMNLTPNTKYTKFQVFAVNSQGLSKPLDINKSCITKASMPHINPTKVEGTGNETDNMVVTWEPMKEKQHHGPGFYYRVVIRSDSMILSSQAKSTESAVVFSNLPAKKMFKIYVYAGNREGRSRVRPDVYKGCSGKSVEGIAPQKVTAEQKIQDGKTVVVVKWRPTERPKENICNNFQGYKVRSWSEEEGENYYQEDIVSYDTFEITLKNFKSNTKYSFKVLAYNLGMESKPSNTVSVQVGSQDLCEKEIKVKENKPGGKGLLNTFYTWDNTNDFEQGSRSPCPGWVCFDQRKPPTEKLIIQKVSCQNKSSWPEDKHVDAVWTEDDRACIRCGAMNKHTEVQKMHYATPASLGDFPWVVTIYTPHKDTRLPTFACGGTIISPHLILSAAHCFFEDPSKTPQVRQKDSDLRIGFNSAVFDKSKEESDFLLVKRVDIGEGYAGPDSAYSRDIAILTLFKRMRFSKYRSPACVNWKFPKVESNTMFLVAGFGKNEHGVQVDQLGYGQQTFSTYRACAEILSNFDKNANTQDKLCISEVNKVRPDEGDSGGGMVQVKDDVAYIVGIVSMKTPNLVDKNFSLYTNIHAPGMHSWVKQKWEEKYPDKEVRLEGTQNGTLEGVQKFHGKLGGNVTLSCPVGDRTQVVIWTRNNMQLDPKDCHYNSTVNGSLQILRLMPSDVGEYECVADDDVDFFERNIINLTITDNENKEVTQQREVYEWKGDSKTPCQGWVCYRTLTPRPSGPERQVSCDNQNSWPQDTGVWTTDGRYCSVCGVSSRKSGDGWSPNETTERIGTFPWVAALFIKMETNWNLRCGGTLIHPRMVITAATCLSKIDDTFYGAADVRVGFGPGIEENNSNNNSSTLYQVQNVIIPKQYKGFDGNYRFDMTILVLDTSVHLSNDITPACMNLALNGSSIRNGNLAYVSGFGTNIEKSKLTKKYRTHFYMDRFNCTEIIKQASGVQIGKGRMCVENVEGEIFNDRGSGLTTIDKGVHYLAGISSYTNKNILALNISLYTDLKVKENLEWLEDTINEHDKN